MTLIIIWQHFPVLVPVILILSDYWLPDFVAAAEFGWAPPKGKITFDSFHQRINRHLNILPDVSNLNPGEVDPHVWDAIWLKD